MTRPLRECKWAFDSSPVFAGLTDDTRWNGFLNVYVTDQTRQLIVHYLCGTGYPEDVESADDIAALPIQNGLVPLTHGWAITEIETAHSPSCPCTDCT